MTDARLVKELLDACALRHTVVANNIANVNVPGYRRSEVRFEKALARALAGGGDLRGPLETEIVTPKDTPVRPDGNDVDLNREIGIQTRNGLLYRTCLEVLDHKIRMLRRAIGRR
jgi:flagellar basal-body rod protein FlgB